MALTFRISDKEGGTDITLKGSRLDLPEYSKQILYQTAKEVLAEEQMDGFDKNPRVRTDNKFDKPEKEVRAFGKIEYYARQDFKEAIVAIYDRLLALSPVGDTQFYKNTHIVVLNGSTIAENKAELVSFLERKDFEPGDKLRFVNAMPYARKLELNARRKLLIGPQKGSYNTKKRMGPSSRYKTRLVRKPNGTYVAAWRYARSKFKSVSNFISFQFLTGDALGISSSPVRSGFRTSFKKDGRPYLYPTIALDFSPSGVLQ